jgi:multicomponent Na+:H+ antiporter subunit B
VTRRVRIAVFVPALVVLFALLLWGFAGMPDFGHYRGPYGFVLERIATPERHVTNVVNATTYDYRGFDTMGEELILFASASAVALLLRETRDYQTDGIVDAVRSDAVNGLGALTAVAMLLLGLYVAAHGLISPGGGFQGGVVLAGAVVVVFLATEYAAYAHIGSTKFAEPLESVGAVAYVGLGLVSFGFGLAFLENFLDFGVTGRLRSGGSAALLNWASALAVAGGFLVIFAEYLQENMAVRYGRKQ